MNTNFIRLVGLLFATSLLSGCLGGKGPDPTPNPVPPPETLNISSVVIREYLFSDDTPIFVQEQLWKEGHLSLENTNILDLFRPDIKYHTTLSYVRSGEDKVEIRTIPNIKKLNETKPYLTASLQKGADGVYSGYEVEFAENITRIPHMLGHETSKIEGQDNSKPTLISNSLHDIAMDWDIKGKLSSYTVTNKTENKNIPHISSRKIVLKYQEVQSLDASVSNIRPGVFWAISPVFGLNPSLGLHTYNVLSEALKEPKHLPISMTEIAEGVTNEYQFSYAWFSPTELHIARIMKEAAPFDSRNRKFIIHFNVL